MTLQEVITAYFSGAEPITLRQAVELFPLPALNKLESEDTQ